MKAKISHLIMLSVTSGALFAGYLFAPAPEKPPTKKSSAAKVVVKSTTTATPVITPNVDWAVEVFDDMPVDEANLHADLTMLLTTLKPDAAIHLTNVAAIARCPDCVQLLKDYLLAGNLSKKQLAQAAHVLSRGNHPELAAMLVDVTAKLLQTRQDKRSELLLHSLTAFNAAPVAQRFMDYLAQTTDLPRALQDALINNINETKQRAQVTDAVVQRFNASSDIAQQQRLLAINQPEALVQIHAQASTQGNTELAQQTLEQLKSNPSQYALDALLTLKNHELLDAAYTLANRQFSGNRLDYIENKLTQGGYSEQDKAIVLDVLSHSEDTARAADIIATFSPQS